MRRDRLEAAILIVTAAAVGALAWNGSVLLLPLSILFPALWSMARHRLTAALVSVAYFLSASRGLPQGIATFYGSDIWPGLALWLVASSGFVLVHSILWTRQKGWRRAARYFLAASLMAVPPFGILGWAQPITAAGVLFPGWGWFGLCMMAAGLVVMTTGLRPAAAMTLAGFWLWSAAGWTPPVVAASWYGVDQKRGSSLGRDTSLEANKGLAAKVVNARRKDDQVAVLPESALGFWTSTAERFWSHRLVGTGLTIVSGAAALNPSGEDNVLVAVSEHGGTILYQERMPVPGAMWQPWRSLFGQSGGTEARFFSNPVVTVQGARVAPLICYEQLIIWPILQSMLHSPDLIVGVGNGWWTAGTSIVGIQRANLEAWARLFNEPLVTSFNM